MKNYVILRKGLWAVGLLLLLGIGMGAYGYSRVAERQNCPGKVFCSITGEEICKDQCPRVDFSRADCPGKIECPITGELVCRDRCPLGPSADTSEPEGDLPACCRGIK